MMDAAKIPIDFKPISADSHVTEPPECYSKFIDPKFRARAPYLAFDKARGGDQYIIEGLAGAVPVGLIAAAGMNPKDIKDHGVHFSDLHSGGWDPKVRMADQDRDGIGAEFVYPTVGMMICNHPDADFKNACFRAYNQWLQEYCAAAPGRLFGLGQTAMRSPAEAIEDFRRIKEMGFRGVMLPGEPVVEDYDSPLYEPLWRAAVELDLPLSFHVLTTRRDNVTSIDAKNYRGPKINYMTAIMRSCQDIAGMFIYGGVFDRNPDLKVVLVEADAGWAPHYMFRMDHFYNQHRFWLKCDELKQLPSETFKANIYMTFQDDWVAFKTIDMMNPRRLMWANDFPHSDSTWPHSQALLAEHTSALSPEQKHWVLRGNVSELYGLPVH